jgi:NADPH-dependent 2,4-dienoyl-CoA reductase/sulfur reductase-like enzyme/rhodanese-related sulfurtransferase
MSKRLVIIGGVAGGATAAARARRLDERAEIVLVERGPEVSFANCGLPYHIGGEISKRAALLVQTSAGLSERFRLDVRTRTEAIRIDRQSRSVRLRDLASGREYVERYDDLLLAPGARPLVPPIPGVDHPAVHTLRNMQDMDRIKKSVDGGARSAIVVGGGFIGLEMAENLRRRGREVTLVELLPQVMPPLDFEVAARLHRELTDHDVRLHLGDAVTAVEDADGRARVRLRGGGHLEADLLVLSVGIRPESGLAREAGLELSERGAILVDEHMRTSDPHIYAVGDAVQVTDRVLGIGTLIPLAGPANRQARIAADNIFGRPSRYRGGLGTSVVRVFRLTVAATGASEKALRQRNLPFQKVYVHRGHHAGYFPGAHTMMIKLLFTPGDGRILGAQIVGREGVDKRIDVLATALCAGLTVHDLEDLELAYAPQYGAAKDPLNIAGYVAVNALRGDEEFVYAEELDDRRRSDWTIVDVRQPAEFQAGHVPGAVLIPLGELRDRWSEIPGDKPLAVYCTVGHRAYYATRVLRDKGLRPRNLAGGITTYSLVHAGTPPTGPPAPGPRLGT